MKSMGLWVLGGLLLAACNGHSSPTEALTKRTPPVISNLSNPARAILLPAGPGQRLGILPISFDFVDPNAELTEVIVTFPEGPATNSLASFAGQAKGMISFQQALLLPPSGKTVSYSVKVFDDGTPSNVLTGSYIAP